MNHLFFIIILLWHVTLEETSSFFVVYADVWRNNIGLVTCTHVEAQVTYAKTTLFQIVVDQDSEDMVICTEAPSLWSVGCQANLQLSDHEACGGELEINEPLDAPLTKIPHTLLPVTWAVWKVKVEFFSKGLLCL